MMFVAINDQHSVTECLAVVIFTQMQTTQQQQQ